MEPRRQSTLFAVTVYESLQSVVLILVVTVAARLRERALTAFHGQCRSGSQGLTSQSLYARA